MSAQPALAEPVQDPPAAEAPEGGRGMASNAAWTAGTSLAARLVGVAGTLTMTRFLAPEDTGQVGVAFVLVASAGQLSSVGLGVFLVANPKAPRSAPFHVTLFHVLFGLVAAGILLAFAGDLAGAFGGREAARFIPGLLAAMLLERFATVPERMLMRDLRFRPVALTRAGSELVFVAVAVSLAAAGWGGFAIVVGNIAQVLFRLAFWLFLVPARDWLLPRRLSGALTKRLFRFGLPLWVSGTTSFASRTWDNLLFARFFGPAEMALYQLAYNLASIPAVNIGEPIADVLVPSFARMEPSRRGEALVRTFSILALLVFPLAIGLGAVGASITAALFDDRWQGIAPILAALSFFPVAASVGWTVMSYLQAQHRPRLSMALEVGKALLLLGAIALFARRGVLWACFAVDAAFTIAAIAALALVARTDGVPFSRLAGAVGRPLLCCLPMAGAVLALRHASAGAVPALVEAIAGVLVGAVVYVAAAFVMAPVPAREALAFIRKLAKRGR